MFWIRNIEQKIFVHWTIVWNRQDWCWKIECRRWNVRRIAKTIPTWQCDSDVAFYFVSTVRPFTFFFEIKMWIRPSREKIVEHREDSYSRYTKRMEDAQKRIEEKNIVLWDFVICTRRLDWIVQREWQFTWEIVKQYEYWNIRYYVEFERNWMKRIYPISIDEIKKA